MLPLDKSWMLQFHSGIHSQKGESAGKMVEDIAKTMSRIAQKRLHITDEDTFRHTGAAFSVTSGSESSKSC